ncbi:MAG: hypothetical protein J5892_04765 [Bacilli bacterium]|nr:hypothetical protein [Bacilli bacterium]
MRELGGFFELENFNGKEYYDFSSFNLSRNCLEYIIRVKEIKRIYLPYYCCDCLEFVCKKTKVDIVYYHINEQFQPILDNVGKLEKNEYIYIINYFGFLSNSYLRKIKDGYNNIIVDNSQAFFQEPLLDSFTIYNCRKYFGVPDGAYLYTPEEIKEEYPQALSYDRMIHLLGRYEATASDFYSKYVENEEKYNNFDIQFMSKITKNILGALNYDTIKEKRLHNYNYVNSKLSFINKIKCKDNCTFMYPLLIKDGNVIRKMLIDHRVYVPILWPGLDKHPLNDFEKELFSNLLPLPIDHRYGDDEMDYIINLIVRSDNNEKN